MDQQDKNKQDETSGETTQTDLPFENLFLNRGFITGNNTIFAYLLVSVLTITVYLLAPLVTLLPLVYMAQNAGIMNDIIIDPYALLDFRKTGFDRNIPLAATLMIYFITVLFFAFFLSKIQTKSIRSVFTGYDRIRWKKFWFSFGIWSLLLVLSFILEYLINPARYSSISEITSQVSKTGGLVQTPTSYLVGLLITFLLLVVFLPFQTGFEELFFRGYIVQGISPATGGGFIPLIISSLLFGGAHMMNPEVDAYGIPVMLTYYSVFGFFMGAVALLDEGLELAWGIHLANNLISSLLVTSGSSVIKTYALFEEKTSNLYYEMASWAICALITFFIFKKKYRWHNFRLLYK
jgi:membrane protease YdiL (CAAX protease family)